MSVIVERLNTLCFDIKNKFPAINLAIVDLKYENKNKFTVNG